MQGLLRRCEVLIRRSVAYGILEVAVLATNAGISSDGVLILMRLQLHLLSVLVRLELAVDLVLLMQLLLDFVDVHLHGHALDLLELHLSRLVLGRGARRRERHTWRLVFEAT